MIPLLVRFRHLPTCRTRKCSSLLSCGVLSLLGGLLIAPAVHGQVISTIAGNGGAGYSGDGGPATSASLSTPAGVAVDAAGNIYIADQSNCRIRKVATDVLIRTVAGNGTCGFSGDGGPATTASISRSPGVSVDASGNLYIADLENCRIRKVAANGIISTVAGNGTCGFTGDSGPATGAAINVPFGVAVDFSGNIYFSEVTNCRVRKVAANGLISVVAGNGTCGFSGDGGSAVSAGLNYPYGVIVDAEGAIYIADYLNWRIRKVAPNGLISTIAGSGLPGFSGDSGPAISASLYGAAGLALDGRGNLYIADYGNRRLRRVTPDGLISTVAGNGTEGPSGDDGHATSASLLPFAVAIDASSTVYVGDLLWQSVRKVPRWTWPIGDSELRRPFAQDYAEFGSFAAGKHHTGFDIAAPQNTHVVAASDGAVVTLQRNDTRASNSTCHNPTPPANPSGCADHGFGNTLILRHDLGSGKFVYSQYSHMQGFDQDVETLVTTDSRCDVSNGGMTYICSPDQFGLYTIAVKTGGALGFVGRTGDGREPYGSHLHFEMKRFSTLNSVGDALKGFGFGYTFRHPDILGYIDPSMFVEVTSSLVEVASSQINAEKPEPRVIVEVTADGLASANNLLRAGPRIDYNCMIESPTCKLPGCQPADLSRDQLVCNRGPATGKFIATRTSGASIGCDRGWYQVVRLDRDVSASFTRAGNLQGSGYFPKVSLSQSGANPDAWICRGSGGTVWTRQFRTGELNGDGKVDQKDLCVLNSDVRAQAGSGRPAIGPDDPLDLNGDGRVDGADVQIMGRLCSPNCSLAACPLP